MTPEQLKGSILQAAIKGKLSSQSNADSNVDEALEKMRCQREELINEGKLKKEGKINKTADTEIDIPSTWRLVPLKELVCKRVDNRGKTPPHSHVKTPNECIDLLEIASIVPGKSIDHSRVEKFVTKETYNQQRGFVEKDDILIATVGSIGKFALMDDTKSAVAQNIIAIKCFDIVDQHYVFYLLQSPYFYSAMGCIKMEAVQASIKVPDLMNLNVPLPPIEEQHRIVAKIEELLPYVDRYAEAYEKLEQFNTKFPEDMKKSILQYAIQGKLVEQRPEEGTAEELYQQIQDERKNYKIKELLVDALDDVPFDIPETWKWVHLQDIVKKTIKRGKSPKYTEKSEVQVFAQKCNVKTGGINMGLALFLDKSTIEKYPTEEYMCDGDIVINSTGGGTMGRVGVFHDTDRINNLAIVPDSHVTVIRACDSINYKFLYYFIKHNQKYLETQGEGSTNQTELKPLTIASLMLPLPPLEEQYRIVAKIEELLPFCDRLLVKE